VCHIWWEPHGGDACRAPWMNPLDRRRAPRVRTAPRHVRLPPRCEGTLLDVSELGALVQLPLPQAPEKKVVLHLQWSSDETLYLRARVVWSTQRRSGRRRGVIAPVGYLVGLEFRDVPDEIGRFLKGIAQNG
jgi:hypothetical protein